MGGMDYDDMGFDDEFGKWNSSHFKYGETSKVILRS